MSSGVAPGGNFVGRRARRIALHPDVELSKSPFFGGTPEKRFTSPGLFWNSYVRNAEWNAPPPS